MLIHDPFGIRFEQSSSTVRPKRLSHQRLNRSTHPFCLRTLLHEEVLESSGVVSTGDGDSLSQHVGTERVLQHVQTGLLVRQYLPHHLGKAARLKQISHRLAFYLWRGWGGLGWGGDGGDCYAVACLLFAEKSMCFPTGWFLLFSFLTEFNSAAVFSCWSSLCVAKKNKKKTSISLALIFCCLNCLLSAHALSVHACGSMLNVEASCEQHWCKHVECGR